MIIIYTPDYSKPKFSRDISTLKKTIIKNRNKSVDNTKRILTVI